MKNNTIIVALVAIVLLLAFAVYNNSEFRAALKIDGEVTDTTGPNIPLEDGTENCDTCGVAHALISVDGLLNGETVSVGQVISGRARGYWFFEGSFPVRVLDANGNEIGINIATAQGDWMTEDFVPFTLTLNYSAPSTPTGKIRFEKDNPSGEPQNDDFYEVSVNF